MFTDGYGVCLRMQGAPFRDPKAVHLNFEQPAVVIVASAMIYV